MVSRCTAVHVMKILHVLSTLTLIFEEYIKAYACQLRLFLIAGLDGGGGGCAEAHSSDEAKTCRAQDKLCSIFVSRMEVRAFLFFLF